MSDLGDKQAFDLAALRAPVVCGRRMYTSTTNRVMEDLCYDATMPVDSPVWRSIDEADVPEPPAAPVPIPEALVDACVVAFGGNKVAAAVTLALLGVALMKPSKVGA